MLVHVCMFYNTLPGRQDCRFINMVQFNYNFDDSLKNEISRHFPGLENLSKPYILYVFNDDAHWEVFREPIFDTLVIKIGIFMN